MQHETHFGTLLLFLNNSFTKMKQYVTPVFYVIESRLVPNEITESSPLTKTENVISSAPWLFSALQM